METVCSESSPREPPDKYHTRSINNPANDFTFISVSAPILGTNTDAVTLVLPRLDSHLLLSLTSRFDATSANYLSEKPNCNHDHATSAGHEHIHRTPP